MLRLGDIKVLIFLRDLQLHQKKIPANYFFVLDILFPPKSSISAINAKELLFSGNCLNYILNSNLHTQRDWKTDNMKRLSDADKRVLAESEYRKLHGGCTSFNQPSAFGSISNLRKASGLPRKKVLAYLETSKTFTKFKPAGRKFSRLPVISLGINHIWSLDVAYIEKIAKFNDGVKYLLLAVDSLSRKIRVQPLKSKTALAAKLAFERLVNFETFEFPMKLWADEGKEFKVEFKKSAEKMRSKFTILTMKPKPAWLKCTQGHWKLYYTNLLRNTKLTGIFLNFKNLYPLWRIGEIGPVEWLLMTSTQIMFLI